MTIKIDQRQCGAGKTTTTLYTHINRFRGLNQPTLIVVPSIQLQNQYQQQYPTLKVVNSDTVAESTVNKAIIELMMDQHPLICITHQAFLLLPDLEQKCHYRLIIDESLDNLYLKQTVPTYQQNPLVNVNWEKHFSLVPNAAFTQAFTNPVDEQDKIRYSNSDFAQLDVVDSSRDEICLNSRQYQHITSQNYTWYISPDDYHILCTGRQDHFSLFGIVKAHIMLGWQGIVVAAAAFKHTKMAHWLTLHQLPTTTLKDCHFIPHSLPITLHFGDMDLWSLSKQRNQKDYHDSYQQQIDTYIDACIQQQPYLALRNKNQRQHRLGVRHEHLVGHNVHGINDPQLSACRHVVIQSALNLDKQFEAFLRRCFLVAVPEALQANAIAQMHSINLFYQVIMRSALRKGQSCALYVMDRRVANGLQVYFSGVQAQAIPLSQPAAESHQLTAKQQTKRVQKEQQLAELMAHQQARALTGAEHTKLHRLRKSLGITRRTSR